jgi:hypothetical protein
MEGISPQDALERGHEHLADIEDARDEPVCFSLGSLAVMTSRHAGRTPGLRMTDCHDIARLIATLTSESGISAVLRCP